MFRPETIYFPVFAVKISSCDLSAAGVIQVIGFIGYVPFEPFGETQVLSVNKDTALSESIA